MQPSQRWLNEEWTRHHLSSIDLFLKISTSADFTFWIGHCYESQRHYHHLQISGLEPSSALMKRKTKQQDIVINAQDSKHPANNLCLSDDVDSTQLQNICKQIIHRRVGDAFAAF